MKPQATKPAAMVRILALLLLGGMARPADQPELFSDIGSIETGLSEITGLPFSRPVPYGVFTKEQLRAFLEKRIRKALKPEDLREEELILRMLGFIPPDFDLRKNTVDLLTEQAAAFYDYNEKKLFILKGASGADDRAALVHELAHALADQNFHLEKYIRDGARSDDGSTARLAVMEGQATWLMAAYLAKQNGGAAEVSPAALDAVSSAIQNSAGDYPVFNKAPLYIRESLVFPYAEGMRFQDAVFRKLSRESFAEVFKRAPVSTQQILHPELYLERRAPVIPPLPRVDNQRQFRKLADGNLGEFDYRVMLTQYGDAEEAKQAAAHIAGSAYALLEHKREKYPVLIFASNWDSPESAHKYFELYRHVAQGKWKKCEIESESATELTGSGDTGHFRIWIDGATVNQIEGWRSSLK